MLFLAFLAFLVWVAEAAAGLRVSVLVRVWVPATLLVWVLVATAPAASAAAPAVAAVVAALLEAVEAVVGARQFLHHRAQRRLLPLPQLRQLDGLLVTRAA